MNIFLLVVAILQSTAIVALSAVILRFVRNAKVVHEEEFMKCQPDIKAAVEMASLKAIETVRDRPSWTPERKEAHRAALRASHERRKKAQQNGVTAELKNLN